MQDYFGLSVGKIVGLRSIGRVVCDAAETDPTTGEVTLLRCTLLPEATTAAEKPKVSGNIAIFYRTIL